MSDFHARVCAFALAAALCAGPACAKATADDYKGCDGYEQALEDTDGITVHWTVWGNRTTPGALPETAALTMPGRIGIADCDAALADLDAKHWLRKVSLLRARAMHRLQDGDAKGALADLDLAEAAGAGGDIFYARSLGAGVSLLRARALAVSGDSAAAEALALRTLDAYPYSREMIGSTMLALGPAASEADALKEEEYLARLSPVAIDGVYLSLLARQDFAGAVALYPSLEPPREVGQVNISGGLHHERDLRDFETEEVFWANRSGARAFALAALDRTAEAKAALQAARDRIATNAAAPAPTPAALSQSEHAKQEALRGEIAAVHDRVRNKGTKILDAWTLFVNLRLMAGAGKGAEMIKEFQAHPLPKGWPSIEILNAIERRLPKAEKPKTPLAQPWRDALEQDRVKMRGPSPEDLYRALPDVETAGRIPPYAEVSKSLFNNDPNGFIVKTEGDVTKVTLRGDMGTGAMIEEMALLKAAELARNAGKKGFVVVERMDTVHVVSIGSIYGSSTLPHGFDTEIGVEFVDSAALHGKYSATPWRVLDADAVYSALAPVYIKAK